MILLCELRVQLWLSPGSWDPLGLGRSVICSWFLWFLTDGVLGVEGCVPAPACISSAEPGVMELGCFSRAVCALLHMKYLLLILGVCN